VRSFVDAVDMLQVLSRRGKELGWPVRLDVDSVVDVQGLIDAMDACFQQLMKHDDKAPLVVQVWLHGGGMFLSSTTVEGKAFTHNYRFVIKDNQCALECALDYGVINHRQQKPPMYLQTLPSEFLVHHKPSLSVQVSAVNKLAYTVTTLGPTVSGRRARYALQSGVVEFGDAQARTALTFVTDYYFRFISGLPATEPLDDPKIFELTSSTTQLIPPAAFLRQCRFLCTHWRLME
jgi:hypothetical protein